MGTYQRAAMSEGILPHAGVPRGVIEFFFVERPARIDWVTEFLWFLLSGDATVS